MPYECLMRAHSILKQALEEILLEQGITWPERALIESPKDPRHGDLATNVPMILTKQMGIAPRVLAQNLADALMSRHHEMLAAEVAGPGFLNITFSPTFWQETVLDVERKGKRFGSSTLGAERRVQVEFVSANPTGPLHIGHGRGAAVGDSLARLLRFTGFDVSTEYYINDAGRQMRLLGLSVYLRLREVVGLPVTWPEDYYRGSYIRDIAIELLEKRPELPTLPEAEAQDICYEYAMKSISDGIKKDLSEFRVEEQQWYSERSLVENGSVERTLKRLLDQGRAYEKDDALWFNTTALGDDKDRVLRKSDGTLTYFASDIAYHDDKFERGFDLLIDVWGADHHGYIPRMRAAIEALGRDPQNAFAVVLIQLVNLLRGGEQVAMSTRSGEFDTLADVVAEVGTDAARFMFLSRKSDSPLDFDLELVKQRNMDNPVYYVQYAHARVSTLLQRAAERGITIPTSCDQILLAPLHGPEELALLRAMDQFEDVVQAAALARTPHSISHYLMDVAGKLHSYYANHQVLGNDARLTAARLGLLRAVAQVIHNGLALLGVSAPSTM